MSVESPRAEINGSLYCVGGRGSAPARGDGARLLPRLCLGPGTAPSAALPAPVSDPGVSLPAPRPDPDCASCPGTGPRCLAARPGTAHR